jgi:uncharacterized protein YbjT (DUF2867 family)
MKIAVIGGTGLIGSAVVAHLSARGHTVVSMSRSPAPSNTEFEKVDVSEATSPSYWLPHLNSIEAVVNCAGVLQDSRNDSTSMVHHHGIANLFAACEQLKIRRVIHFSAIGVDRETPSAFSETKLHGDTALMERDLDWVILRPSVVIGRPAYGASALMRGLAALPATWVMPNTGQLQIVLLEDVVRTVATFLDPGAPSRRILELVGPQQHSFAEVVSLFRRWYRWPPAREIRLPQFASGMLYKLGDAISLLGWRPPVRSTAEREITRGATGTLADMQRIGIHPKSLSEFLASEPASVQERWFAPIYAEAAVVCRFVLVLDHDRLRVPGTMVSASCARAAWKERAPRLQSPPARWRIWPLDWPSPTGRPAATDFMQPSPFRSPTRSSAPYSCRASGPIRWVRC